MSFDKIGHLVFYAVLFFFVCMALQKGRLVHNTNASITWSFLYCMVLGVGMELAQLLMHVGRSFDILDLIANIIGTTMGVVAFRLYIKF